MAPQPTRLLQLHLLLEHHQQLHLKPQLEGPNDLNHIFPPVLSRTILRLSSHNGTVSHSLGQSTLQIIPGSPRSVGGSHSQIYFEETTAVHALVRVQRPLSESCITLQHFFDAKTVQNTIRVCVLIPLCIWEFWDRSLQCLGLPLFGRPASVGVDRIDMYIFTYRIPCIFRCQGTEMKQFDFSSMSIDLENVAQ